MIVRACHRRLLAAINPLPIGLEQRSQFIRVPRREKQPVHPALIGTEHAAITTHHLRRVIARIETQGDQGQFVRQSGIFPAEPLQLVQYPRGAQTGPRIGAAGVDETQHRDPPVQQFMQPHSPAFGVQHQPVARRL
jgi:hypothetical protein